MTQYVTTVHSHMMPRVGSDGPCAGFTFEIFRGTEDECNDMADRFGGAYSDKHHLVESSAIVTTAELWQRYIDENKS